jgi:hypothetical protein
VDEASTEQADGVSTEATSPLRSDAPAALSAIPQAADIEHAGLSDEEVDEYRRRVASGMYNTREVADEVARRMMSAATSEHAVGGRHVACPPAVSRRCR